MNNYEKCVIKINEKIFWIVVWIISHSIFIIGSYILLSFDIEKIISNIGLGLYLGMGLIWVLSSLFSFFWDIIELKEFFEKRFALEFN